MSSYYSVKKEDFRAFRYNTDDNPHFDAIRKGNEKLYQNWTNPEWKGNFFDVQAMTHVNQHQASIQEQVRETLKVKLIDDKHWTDCPYLIQALQAPSIGGVDYSKSEGLETVPLIELLSLKDDQSIVTMLDSIVKDLGNQETTPQFNRDLNDLLCVIRQPSQQVKDMSQLTFNISDDPDDILLCGTEILGSCQRVSGSPSFK